MKKLIVLLAAMAVGFTAMAQETAMDDEALAKAIVGTYTTKTTENMQGGGGRIITEETETFGEDGTYVSKGTLSFRATVPQQGSVRVDFATVQEGTYRIEGGVIKFVIDPESIELNLTSSGGSELDDMVVEYFDQMIEKQRSELASKPELNEQGYLTIVSIDDKQMVTKPVGGSKKTVHKRK